MKKDQTKTGINTLLTRLRKPRPAVFGVIVYTVLFAFLQQYSSFHFFFIEQSQLFQCTGESIAEKLAMPGGFVYCLSEYLMQFFMYPYAGAGITAALLVLTGLGMRAIVRRIIPDTGLFLLYLVPVLFILFVHFDFNYLIAGTIAFNLMLFTFYLYLCISDNNRRMIAALVATPLLYGLAGAVGCLFALSVCLYELLRKTPRFYMVSLAVVLALLCGVCSVHLALLGEYRLAFFPDAYYYTALLPKPVIYFSWCSFLVILMLAFLLKKRKKEMGVKGLIAGGIVQLGLLLALCGWGIPRYGDQKSAKVKELDYYARTEQWDKIIAVSGGAQVNYLNLCYLNLALAQQGELAERMFSFDQRGPQGMMVGWNKTEHISILLSDISFAMGNSAVAQEMAFEAYATAIGGGNPRMLKRLVQTNLVYGEYPVAEKYLNLLGNTVYYKAWANKYRRFLYNDAAVEQDSVLGMKRRCLPKENYLADINQLEKDLYMIAEANPQSKSAIHYLGGFYLLAKDMGGFRKMVETYYGTAVLPALPKSFQEAVITLSETDSEYWKRFDISPSVMQRFVEYKKQILENRNNKNALPGLMRRAYGDTYWFYFMFK